MIYRCIGRYSESAYQIPELTCSIHSFEELCYVLNENLYSLGDYIICDELIRYIEISLELKDLAESLIRKKRQPVEYIMTIFSYKHFMPESRAEKVRKILSSMEDIREYVRLKSRADFLNENKRYKSAILMYEHVLKLMDEEKDTDVKQKEEVLLKLASIYSLYYMFDKAADCYGKAGDEKKRLLCKKLSLSRVNFSELLLKERPPEQLVNEINAMFREPEEIAEIKAKRSKGDKKAAEEAARSLAESLKAKYRRIS